MNELSDNHEVIDASATPEPGSAASLRGDDAFMEKYLAGDRDAVAQYTAAIQSDVAKAENEEPAEASPGDYGTIDFKEFTDQLSTEELLQSNTEAREMAAGIGCPKEMVQPFYDRIVQCGKEFGNDPEAQADTRRETLVGELSKQWGDGYAERMERVLETLKAHPEIDELLYSSGAWADPWVIGTLSRVIEKEL
ncbi:MAG: hypothetical protein ABW149_00020 [Sedimenticola sp.]